MKNTCKLCVGGCSFEERCNKDEVHLVFSLLEPPSWRNLNYHHQYNFHSNILWAPLEYLKYHSSISNITQTPQNWGIFLVTYSNSASQELGLLHSFILYDSDSVLTNKLTLILSPTFFLLQLSTRIQKFKYPTPNIRYTMPNLAEQST